MPFRKPASPKKPLANSLEPAIPVVVQEVERSEAAHALADKIFEAYHETVISEFEKRPTFGFSRTFPHPGFSPYLNSSFTRFDFTFIGNDPAVRKYRAEDPALDGGPLVFHMSDAYRRREEERNAVMLKNVDPFQRNTLHAPDALFDKDLKPEVSLPSEAELALIARFESQAGKTVEFHPEAGGTFGYGAVRATATCLQCHEKEEGSLLGLFRYRFEHGPADTVKDLAVQ